MSILILLLSSVVSLSAASNPVPNISIVTPTAVAPGSADFTLSVLGTGFINGQSAIFWNGAALPDPTVCTAAAPPNMASCAVTVRAAMVATATTANITVVNPGPGGGKSNVVSLPVAAASTTVGFKRADISPSFGTPFYQLSGVGVGDLNGDGKLDLILTINSVNLVFMLGNGDGTFAPSPSSPYGEKYIFQKPEVIVRDFNNDGIPDVMISDEQGGYVFVMLGTGNAKFGSPVFGAPRSFSPAFAAVGDFNGDGILDFARTDAPTSKVQIYLGNPGGFGSFTLSTTTFPSGPDPQAIVAGDFNSDGQVDLAILNGCNITLPCTTNGTVSVLLGDGTGNFTPVATKFAVGAVPAKMIAGDFDGDGKLDLLVLNACANDPTCVSPASSNMTLLLGDGTGNFSASSTSPIAIPSVDPASVSFQASDYNGDGKLDAVLGTPNAIFVLEGDGAGNFNPVTYSISSNSITGYAAAIGDFNGDGKLDIAGSTNLDLSVFLQSPFLTIAKTHSGNFSQGQTGASYTLTVSNQGSLPSSGPVTVADTLPVGLTAIAASGTGWDCSGTTFPVVGDNTATVNCTRADALLPGASYPPINLVTNVAANAPASLTNTATVTGGGSDMNTASDPTNIVTYNVTLPPHVGLGTQVVGTTSTVFTFELTVGGNGTLTISNIAVSGDFAQTNDCGSTVPAGTSCTFSVTFTPTATGERTGSLTIVDDSATSPHVVSLSGIGVQPALTLSATSLTFLGQIVGDLSLPQNVTLTNSGTSPLNITNVQTTSSFGDSVGCTSPVPVGSSCSISVFFDPASGGAITGTLTITDDAPGSPHTVALNGTGQDFAVAPAPGSTTTASVAAGSTANFMLELAPAGGFSKTVSLTCSGQPALSACILSPTVVTLNPTTPTPVTVAVTTNSGASVTPLGRVGTPSTGVPPLLGLSLLMAACLWGVMWTLRGRARIRLAFATAVLAVVMMGAVAMPGCGGGMPPAAPSSPGTPAGTYHLNVTATFAQGAETLSHSVQLTLTVH